MLPLLPGEGWEGAREETVVSAVHLSKTFSVFVQTLKKMPMYMHLCIAYFLSLLCMWDHSVHALLQFAVLKFNTIPWTLSCVRIFTSIVSKSGYVAFFCMNEPTCGSLFYVST